MRKLPADVPRDGVWRARLLRRARPAEARSLESAARRQDGRRGTFPRPQPAPAARPREAWRAAAGRPSGHRASCGRFPGSRLLLPSGPTSPRRPPLSEERGGRSRTAPGGPCPRVTPSAVPAGQGLGPPRLTSPRH